eukprot:3627613-Pleurochrysis_carterae.AAC.6
MGLRLSAPDSRDLGEISAGRLLDVETGTHEHVHFDEEASALARLLAARQSPQCMKAPAAAATGFRQAVDVEGRIRWSMRTGACDVLLEGRRQVTEELAQRLVIQLRRCHCRPSGGIAIHWCHAEKGYEANPPLE